MAQARYRVQLMSYPHEQWAVWDRALRREVSWLSTDRKAIVAKVRVMNAAEADHA